MLDAHARLAAIKKGWDQSGNDPSYLLQALAVAHSEDQTPPSWVTRALGEAAIIALKTPDTLSFDRALGLSPASRKKVSAQNQIRLLARMMAELIDAGWKQDKAATLVSFESKWMMDWDYYEIDSLKQYYNREFPLSKGSESSSERNGFNIIFASSLNFTPPRSWESQFLADALSLPEWRASCFQARLDAYMSADNDNAIRADVLNFVTKKTTDALHSFYTATLAPEKH